MELEWIALKGIGDNIGHDFRQSAELVVTLDSGEHPHYPEVSIAVAVDRRAEITWSELEEQIKANALAALDAARAALARGTIVELRQRVHDRRDKLDSEQNKRSIEQAQEALRESLASKFPN